MKHFTPEVKQVRIADVLEKEINLMHPLIEEKNISIINQVPHDLIKNTDENFVSIIVRNLLQNAVKYSEKNGSISITGNIENLRIVNQASHTKIELLNAQLQNKQVDSKPSGLGLQIASDLAASIHSKVFFEQQDPNSIAAVLQWNS